MSREIILVMSPFGRSSKFASYVIWAYLSESEEKTHRHPAASNPSRIPPIPQKRSTNRGLAYLCENLASGSPLLPFTPPPASPAWHGIAFSWIVTSRLEPEFW